MEAILKPGRKPEGATDTVAANFRIPKDLRDAVGDVAAARGVPWAEAARRLILRGLEADGLAGLQELHRPESTLP